jgi:hypothetical protein
MGFGYAGCLVQQYLYYSAKGNKVVQYVYLSLIFRGPIYQAA